MNFDHLRTALVYELLNNICIIRIRPMIETNCSKYTATKTILIQSESNMASRWWTVVALTILSIHLTNAGKYIYISL